MKSPNSYITHSNIYLASALTHLVADPGGGGQQKRAPYNFDQLCFLIQFLKNQNA